MKINKIVNSTKVEVNIADIKNEKLADEIIAFVQGLSQEQLIKGFKGTKYQYIDANEINYAYIENKIVYCVLTERFRVEMSLDKLEGSFYALLRISKSLIINVNEIDYFKPEVNGRHRVILKDGSVHIISRRYYKKVIERLG